VEPGPDGDASFPDWLTLDLEQIYDTLNPRTKHDISEL
jgi:hypothetical protein